jgi:hypothetical protein
MTWYAAHIVMVVRFKSAAQRRFPVWENIVIVKAANAAEALDKAEAIGRADEGDDDESFRWEGKSATWEFAGVRKVVACAMERDRPGDADEVTYNELSFDSLAGVRRFAQGLPATARYDERIPEEPEAASDARRQRKRA